MRFGIYAGPLFPTQDKLSSKQVFANAVKMGKTAHASGFDGIFVGQHYLMDEGQILHPTAILSHLAGRFPGMYFGNCIYLLPLHQPALVAEEIATLDLACGGKFMFGIGQGYRNIEFESIGVRRDERGRRMVEAMQAIRELWTKERASFKGEFYKFENAMISVRPTRKEGPPVLVAADTLATVKKVPEISDYWLVSPRHSRTFLSEAVPLFKAELEKRGRSFKGLPIPREMFVARNGREAEETIKRAFEAMYHTYHRMGQPGEKYDQDFAALKRERLVVGSPDEVADQLLGYHRDFGAEFVWFRLYWPGLDLERSLDAIRLFGEEVLPILKRETGEGRLP